MKGLCTITQLADTPTYVRTIHHLSMHPPSILLIPSSTSGRGNRTTFSSASRSSKRAKTNITGEDDADPGSHADTLQKDRASVLVRTIEQLYDIEVRPFPRKHWNYFEGEHTWSVKRGSSCLALQQQAVEV